MFHWPGLFVNNLPMNTTGPHAHVEACGVPVTEVPKCKRHTFSWTECRLQSWQAMQTLQKQGKIRALGTSNFEKAQLRQLVNTGAKPAVNQVRSSSCDGK
jgi:diketogulonate reductase-like aldo/keto reductase